MADTVSTANELKIGLKFDDADTRLITIPNPVDDLDRETIEQAFSNVVNNNILIGDKTGASITGLYTAYKDETVRTKLDLTPPTP